MQLFSDSASCTSAAGGGRRWQRVGEAIAAARALPAGPAFSIGDSLTYRHGTGAVLGTDDLVGRRRYLFVVAALDGDVVVEVARKAALTQTLPYSDLTDREHFRGIGDRVTVPRGGLLVVDLDEAARILPDCSADAVLLHVTIEASFETPFVPHGSSGTVPSETALVPLGSSGTVPSETALVPLGSSGTILRETPFVPLGSSGTILRETPFVPLGSSGTILPES